MLGRGDVIDVLEMRAIERNASSLGFHEELMMENAGRGIAYEILAFKPRKVLIVAGKGGKAGDGAVAARHLANNGVEVTYLLPFSYCEIKNEAARKNVELLRHSGVRITNEIEDADVIVDAMLGIGTRGPPRGVIAELVKRINKMRGVKVAIDVPTGVDPDTGEIYDPHFDADLVLTIHKMKKGLQKMADKVKVIDIGIPRDAEIYTGPGDLILPRRGEKKGSNGRVAVIGGSERYQGAPWITALSAFRSGADLVYVYAPKYLPYPELIYRNERRPREILARLREEKVNVVVIGPGLGETANEYVELVEILDQENFKMVIDADMIKVLGLKKVRNAIITPHRGEASKILGWKVESLDDCIRAAETISKFYASVILKAPVDVVSSDGRTVLNAHGTNLMTVGGTGDVLAGVTAALYARMDAWRASKASIYATTVAGEQCSEFGFAGPSCLIEKIPRLLNT